MKKHQFTAYAYNASALIRFINNLASATNQSQSVVLGSIRILDVELPLGRCKAVIRYDIHGVDPKAQADYFRNIDHPYFVWPSERRHVPEKVKTQFLAA